MITLEEFLLRCDSGEYTVTDQAEMQQVFTNKSFQRAFREMAQQLEEQARAISRMDLISDFGRLAAIRAQGHVEGGRAVLEALWNSSQTEEEDAAGTDE